MVGTGMNTDPIAPTSIVVPVVTNDTGTLRGQLWISGACLYFVDGDGAIHYTTGNNTGD